MKKLVIAALMLSACRGHSEKAADKAPRELPLPHKLPPAGSGSAAPGEDHAASIDNEYATVLAMYNAPAGATPCETAYNAIEAEKAAATKLSRESIFTFVAPKPDFMKACAALSAAGQQCLAPAYQARHADECAAAKPKDDDLAKLYVLRKDLEPPKEPGQMPQQ